MLWQWCWFWICLFFYLSGSKATHVGFQIRFYRGVQFYKNHLFLLRTSLHDHVIWEPHWGGMGEHFGRDKTITLVEDWFFWSSLKKDVLKVIKQYRACQLGKGSKQNTEFYAPQPVPAKVGRFKHRFCTWITKDTIGLWFICCGWQILQNDTFYTM